MTCPAYRPDHNGECLNCDEWAAAHTPEAIQLGQMLANGRAYQCPRCGMVSVNPNDLTQKYCGRCHLFEQP